MKAKAMKKAIVMATRVASDGDGDGNGGKSDSNVNEGAGQATMRAMAVVTTVAGDDEGNCNEDRVVSGKGGKAMEMVTRVAGKQR